MSKVKSKVKSVQHPTIVNCQNCGALIGSYTERDGKVQLRVGALTVDWAHGVCECGEPFHWRSSERSMALLVGRVLEIRKLRAALAAAG